MKIELIELSEDIAELFHDGFAYGKLAESLAKYKVTKRRIKLALKYYKKEADALNEAWAKVHKKHPELEGRSVSLRLGKYLVEETRE
jgi:intein-encoded DNA endonuclease-like protein